MDMVTKRPASQGPRITDAPSSPFNVFAEFPDMESARAAIEALGSAGIDGDRISLTGPAAADAAERSESREAEAAILGHVFWRALGMGALGAGIGALLGLAVGVIALQFIDAQTSVGNVALAVATGAFTCGIPFALVGYVSSLQPAEPWMLTFQESSHGKAFVGVHTNDEKELRRAEQILRDVSSTVRRYDAEHSPLAPQRSR